MRVTFPSEAQCYHRISPDRIVVGVNTDMILPIAPFTQVGICLPKCSARELNVELKHVPVDRCILQGDEVNQIMLAQGWGLRAGAIRNQTSVLESSDGLLARKRDRINMGSLADVAGSIGCKSMMVSVTVIRISGECSRDQRAPAHEGNCMHPSDVVQVFGAGIETSQHQICVRIRTVCLQPSNLR